LKKKEKFTFLCQSCGAQTPKWMGRCPACGAWDTLVEKKIIAAGPGKARTLEPPKPVPINSVEVSESQRLKTGIAEFDRVLGGGIVDGSLILIGGDPGIGKSTLMLQVLASLAKSKKMSLCTAGL